MTPKAFSQIFISGIDILRVINTLNVFVTIITETGKKIKVLPNTKVPLPVMTRGS